MDLTKLDVNRDLRVQRLRQVRESGQPIRLCILSPSDAEQNSYTQLQWSDYWIKQELIKALGNLPGILVTNYQPHAVLHLFGFPVQLDPRLYTLGWIYGHPDLAKDETLRQYDHLFCYSGLFQKELERRGFWSDLMMAATGKLPQAGVEVRYPVTFVGNARNNGSRPAVTAALESGEPFLVWGNGWKGKLERKHFVADYIDYHQLDELYAASEFVLNDHHPDMARWGFVSFRIFDALASGGFVVSDHNPGIYGIFGQTVPQFSSGGELKDLLKHFRAHPEQKEELRREGMKIALSHCWQARADQIRWHLLNVADPSTKKLTNEEKRSFTANPNARQRLADINYGLKKQRRSPDKIQTDPVRTLSPADLCPGRRLLYIDKFSPDNSNHFWLKSFSKTGAVEIFDIRENLRDLNERTLDFQPQHIHLGGSVKNGFVKPEWLRQMQARLGCTVSVFYGDARFSDYHTQLARVADQVYFSNKTHIRINAEQGLTNCSYLPCPTDPDSFHPIKQEPEFDLLFIGNHNNESRLNLLKKLDARFDLRVAGHDWESTGLKALGPAYGENFSRLCAQARILLGIVGDEWKDLEAYFSNRLVNVMASGAFLLQTYTPGLESVFTNHEHLVWYQDEDELFSQINQYLADIAARLRIAENGYREVTAKYTYDHSVALIMESARSGNLDCLAAKPVETVTNVQPASSLQIQETEQEALDDHWKKALAEAERGGRFTLEWFRGHPITRELLKSPVLQGHVLEIGCGLGQRAFLAHQAKGCRITGMDASWFAVAHAQKTYGSTQLAFEVGDATNMPFPSRSFDNAYMLAVFEHIVESDRLLREIERVLKPGGRIFVSVTENNYHASPDHVHIVTHEELRRAFASLRVVDSYVADHIIFLTATVPPDAVHTEVRPEIRQRIPEMAFEER
jgi:spore maturation protein CgeB/SAM-dependent methyltransferase